MGKRPRLLLSLCMFAAIALAMASTMEIGAQQDPCADPRFRAALQQAQQQFAQVLQYYYSMPPEARAYTDAAVRDAFRSTGYPVSSVPDLQRLIDVCRNWKPPVERPQQPEVPPIVKTSPPPPEEVRRRPTQEDQRGPTPAEEWRGFLDSARESLTRLVAGLVPKGAKRPGPLASAVASDGVVVGSGEMKLGWVLYGRTDMSDEEARAEYRARVQARKAALELASKDAADRLRATESRSEKFEESVAKKNPGGMADILREELGEAKGQHNRELEKLGAALGGLVPGPLGEAVHAGSATSELARFAATAGQKLAAGERLTREDWDLAANGFASYVSVTGALAGSPVVLPIGVAQAGFSLMNVYASQRWVNALEKGIEQTGRPLEENRRLLQHQIEVERAKKQYFDQQIERLNQEGRYLGDLVRP